MPRWLDVSGSGDSPVRKHNDQGETMAKNSKDRNSDKASAKDARHDTAKQDRGSDRTDYRQKGGENREQGSGASGYRQNVGANRDQGSDLSDYRQKAAANRDQESDTSDYLKQVQADKLAEAAKKGSCLPKLFMLLIPFAALGTYLFLRS